MINVNHLFLIGLIIYKLGTKQYYFMVSYYYNS